MCCVPREPVGAARSPLVRRGEVEIRLDSNYDIVAAAGTTNLSCRPLSAKGSALPARVGLACDDCVTPILDGDAIICHLHFLSLKAVRIEATVWLAMTPRQSSSPDLYQLSSIASGSFVIVRTRFVSPAHAPRS